MRRRSPVGLSGALHGPPSTVAANATSNAVTANGAMADALSTAGGEIGEAQSTAKTSLEGVSVQSTVTAPSSITISFWANDDRSGRAGRLGSYPLRCRNLRLLDRPYRQGVRHDADRHVRREQCRRGAVRLTDEILGNRVISSMGSGGTLSTTFDFRFQGDLLLGVIYGFDFDILVNGTQVFATDGTITDTVIDLGLHFGPNIRPDDRWGWRLCLRRRGSRTIDLGDDAARLRAGLGFVGYRATAARLD